MNAVTKPTPCIGSALDHRRRTSIGRTSLSPNDLTIIDPRHRICFSVNPNIIGKPTQDAHKHHAKAWSPVELTIVEMLEHILKGSAIAPQYRDQHRKGVNFVRAGFLAADFDGSMTIHDARNNAFINSHAAFIYTTPSHMSEEHRFRVVFALERSVDDAATWADATLGLAYKLGSDTTVADGARCFYGSSDAASWVIGKIMSVQTLNHLATSGSELRKAKKHGQAIDATQKLQSDALVKLSSGDWLPIQSVEQRTAVHCPNHDDQHASAFVVHSRKGGVGIHCKACALTYWQGEYDDYDFKAFDREFARLIEVDAVRAPDGPGLTRFFPPEPKFEQYCERFLPGLKCEPGITLVKSPKGTGKTAALQTLVRHLQSPEYIAATKSKERVSSVVLIGHRRALLREAAAKLGMNFYLDEQDGLNRGSTLAICLDSLPKSHERYVAKIYNGRPVWEKPKAKDLVIIDESEQVFSHLFGGTIQNKPRAMDQCYDSLVYEIANAKAVIALDADLGMLTAHAMQTMRPQDWHARTRIIYNRPVPQVARRTLQLFSHETALQQELMRAVQKGERCFVACNSRRTANVLHEMIQQKFDKKIACKTITADNSHDTDEIEFVKNISTEFLKIQVLICSPSLGTGIDITFHDPAGTPGGLRKVDHVFGFFNPLVNTHTDMDQQLARVRNPGTVKVWISPTRFQFSSNFDVIRDDLARAYFVPRAVRGKTADGMVDYDPHHPLLMIAAHVTASQRASKNRLTDLFCEHRRAQGWEIERIDTKVPPDKARGRAEAALYARNSAGLMTAPVLNDADFLDLEMSATKGGMSQADKFALERNTIERQLGVSISPAIIKLNYDGKLRGRVENLAAITRRLDEGLKHALSSPAIEILPLERLPAMSTPFLVEHMMRAVGLIVEHAVVERTNIESSRLELFKKVCKVNRTILEEGCAIQIREDLDRNPIRQLNNFLHLVGLKLVKSKRLKFARRTTRYYALDSERLTTMLNLASVYRAREKVISDIKTAASES